MQDKTKRSCKNQLTIKALVVTQRKDRKNIFSALIKVISMINWCKKLYNLSFLLLLDVNIKLTYWTQICTIIFDQHSCKRLVYFAIWFLVVFVIVIRLDVFYHHFHAKNVVIYKLSFKSSGKQKVCSWATSFWYFTVGRWENL